MPDDTLPESTAALFDSIVAVVNGKPQAEVENVLAYMLACVAVQRRAGLPTAGVKAELADLVGKAVDSLAGEPDSP